MHVAEVGLVADLRLLRVLAAAASHRSPKALCSGIAPKLVPSDACTAKAATHRVDRVYGQLGEPETAGTALV